MLDVFNNFDSIDLVLRGFFTDFSLQKSGTKKVSLEFPSKICCKFSYKNLY